MANLTRESLVEWASSWVPEKNPYDGDSNPCDAASGGYRARFAEALRAELAGWVPREELRDKIMMAILPSVRASTAEETARVAYQVADAALVEREKDPSR